MLGDYHLTSSNIKSAYESALKVQNIDDTVCVMSLSRTLEMVCKDKGAFTGQLHQKLNELQQKGILPPLMGDIFKVINDFGNMAAHGTQFRLTSTLWKACLDLLIKYLNTFTYFQRK